MNRSCISMAAIVGLLLGGLFASPMIFLGRAQNRTGPGLVQAGLWLNLNQQSCMDRARDALTAAGLTLQNPTPSARGGTDNNLFAIITCMPCSDRMYVNVAVAMSPGYTDTRKAVFLRDYMQAGQNPGGGNSTGISGGEPLLGSWRGCDGRVLQFAFEGGELIGRYTSLGGLGVFTIGEVGYRARPLGNGRYQGQVKWRWTDGRFEWKPNIITINGNQYSDTGSDGCSTQMTRVSSGSTGNPGGGSGGGASAGGVCADPRTLAVMDEWLVGANPPQNQQPGWSVRYEAWGRLVGRSSSANLTVSGPPDTRMSRCEWLWYYSAGLRSTNLGTLWEHLQRRLR